MVVCNKFSTISATWNLFLASEVCKILWSDPAPPLQQILPSGCLCLCSDPDKSSGSPKVAYRPHFGTSFGRALFVVPLTLMPFDPVLNGCSCMESKLGSDILSFVTFSLQWSFGTWWWNACAFFLASTSKNCCFPYARKLYAELAYCCWHVSHEQSFGRSFLKSLKISIGQSGRCHLVNV